MQRVLIIGTNGAGKSTFARKLAEKTGLPLTHLDRLYWQGDWQVVPREDFLGNVRQVVSGDRWIIDGNNLRSAPERLEAADTVFWLEFSPITCVAQVIKRELVYRGTARPDMPETCKSRIDPLFLRTVWRFNRKNRKRIRNLLQQYPHLQIYHFKNRRQVKRYLNK